jgi:hypothetical protein
MDAVMTAPQRAPERLPPCAAGSERDTGDQRDMKHASIAMAAVAAVASCASASFGQALSEGFDWLGTNSNWGTFTRSFTLQSGTWIGSSTDGEIYRPAPGAWNWTAPQAGTGFANVNTTPNGWTISFWSKMMFSGSPERLRLVISTAGASTSLSSFTTVLLDIGHLSPNPAPYDNTWREFTATISGLSGPVNGRFAFEHTSPQSNGIYLDTVTYNIVPAPGAIAVLGMSGLARGRRRRG